MGKKRKKKKGPTQFQSPALYHRWDLNEGKHLYSLEAGDIINALVFSPNRYWLCAATASCIKIFDLESKSIVDELKPEFENTGKKSREPECVSLA